MQKYLKALNFKIKIEEKQDIFNSRIGASDVKINFKGKYENLECDICKNENETQIHLIECNEINKGKKEYGKPPDYEEMLETSVQNQLKIVRHFFTKHGYKKKMEDLK